MKDKFLEILDELIEMDYDEFHKSLQKHEPGDIAEFIIATGAIEAIFSSVKESDDNFDELRTKSCEAFRNRRDRKRYEHRVTKTIRFRPEIRVCDTHGMNPSDKKI